MIQTIKSESTRIQATEKVTSIVSLIDSRMMDGNKLLRTTTMMVVNLVLYRFRELADAGIIRLANDTAHLYCNCETCDDLDGLQVDLEPYRDPYKTSLNKYVKQVATNLRDETGEFNCKNDKHPKGRTVSYFTFAHDQSLEFTTDVLGANGYYVFSGMI